MNAREFAARPLHDVRSRSTRGLRSLSAVGKRALQRHEECMGVLRHHARANDNAAVGARCRGALAAMDERRGAGTTTPTAVGSEVNGGHLMIS